MTANPTPLPPEGVTQEEIIARLTRKARLGPSMGSADSSGRSVIYDDGMRYVNPDGPSVADWLRARIAATSAAEGEAKGWQAAHNFLTSISVNWDHLTKEQYALLNELIEEMAEAEPSHYLSIKWKEVKGWQEVVSKAEARATKAEAANARLREAVDDALTVVAKLRRDLRKSNRALLTATKLLVDMKWAFAADYESNSADRDWSGIGIWKRLDRFLRRALDQGAEG